MVPGFDNGAFIHVKGRMRNAPMGQDLAGKDRSRYELNVVPNGIKMLSPAPKDNFLDANPNLDEAQAVMASLKAETVPESSSNAQADETPASTIGPDGEKLPF
jgi:hypothetical protein